MNLNQKNVNINGESSIFVTDYVYVYLDKNQELVISSVDLHPDYSELYDNDSNFGKCELQTEDGQKWYEKYQYIRTVRFEGMVKPITCVCWFTDCKNLIEIKNMENLDTSECINMSNMFNGCFSLTKLDLSNFDTSKVTNMDCMFANCTSLTILDVSNFDTNNVTNMYAMFFNCTSLTTLDVSNFDTSKVTTMREMFYKCESLTTLDVSNFDTSKVTNMCEMFYDCKSLHANCSSWNVSKVINHVDFKYRSHVIRPVWCES